MSADRTSVKTVVVAAATGWAIREYLRTDFLPTLAEECRVVVLSPLADEPGFRDEFERDNVRIEVMSIPTLGRFTRELERFLVFSHYYRHPSVMGANDMAFQRTKHIREDLPLRSQIKGRLVRPAVFALARSLGRRLTIDQQLRIERTFYTQLRDEAHRLAVVLAKYRPDLMFATQPVLNYLDRPAVWAAHELGLRTACIIPGWDNLHSKGRMPIHFEHYLVWSEWMRGVLLEQYPEIRADQITIVGPAFLDACFDPELRLPRAEFLRSLGGDPNRKVIVWAGAPKSQTPNQPFMVQDLLDAIRAGRLPGSPQVLLRPHPIGGSAYFAEMVAQYPEVLFRDPMPHGIGAGTQWNYSKDDAQLLVNSVLHADVMVNFSSTITLEAFALDKPVVNVAYDFLAGSDYERLTQGAYSTESYRPVIDMKATRVAFNKDDLIRHIGWYLQHPESEQAERKALLHFVCDVADGGASERAAEALLRLIGLSSRSLIGKKE